MKTLTKDMIPTPPVKYSTPSVFANINEIIEHPENYDFDVPLKDYGFNLQREYVWTPEQQSKFILSILSGADIPACAVNSHCDDWFYEIIDGKQRILTMVKFVLGEFPIEVSGEKYYFEQLEKLLQYRIKFYDISAYIHMQHNHSPETILTDTDKINWFLYINNSGTPQQGEYMENLAKAIK